MSATLLHRGPDSEGSFVDRGVGLAARRLAIIDLEGGDQPLANEDGTCTVVQNGEIYNYAELTRELERLGHRFRTGSDTEAIVHAYEEWGHGFAACSRSRSGMHAVAHSSWRATASASSPSTTAWSTPRSRLRPSSTRCRKASSIPTQSRRSSPSTRSRRRCRSSARFASCRPDTCSRGTTATSSFGGSHGLARWRHARART